MYRPVAAEMSLYDGDGHELVVVEAEAKLSTRRSDEDDSGHAGDGMARHVCARCESQRLATVTATGSQPSVLATPVGSFLAPWHAKMVLRPSKKCNY